MSTLRLVWNAVPRVAALRAVTSTSPRVIASTAQWRWYGSKQAPETDEQFDTRWVNFFNREDIDSWDLRRGVNEIYGHDLVPEPKIVEAMLKAARRLDDVAMAIRILEMVKEKAAGDKTLYSYVLDAIKPTIEELGVKTPEELGIA